MVARSLAAVWHPCTQMKSHERFPLVPISRAEGVWLQDFEGRRYLDAVSSWWVNLFGHSHPYVNAALRDQLGSLSYPDFFDFRRQNRTLASSAVYRDQTVAFTDANGAQSFLQVKCSAEFFDVLGIKPAIGRGFARADEQAGGGPGGFKVILSHDFWQKHFGGEKNALGRTVVLDRRPYTVIGVMPARFQFPIQTESIEFYVTIAEDASNSEGLKPMTEERGNHTLEALPGIVDGLNQAGLAAVSLAEMFGR